MSYLGHGLIITLHSILWDVITYPCFRYLLLPLRSSYILTSLLHNITPVHTHTVTLPSLMLLSIQHSWVLKTHQHPALLSPQDSKVTSPPESLTFLSNQHSWVFNTPLSNQHSWALKTPDQITRLRPQQFWATSTPEFSTLQSSQHSP